MAFERHSCFFALAAIALLPACAAMEGAQDFDRHRMSSIRVSEADPEIYIFEAQISAEYPADNDMAEAVRMEWIKSWMEVRKFCPEGFEVVERRPFGKDEPNPYRSDLRYQLRCEFESAS